MCGVTFERVGVISSKHREENHRHRDTQDNRNQRQIGFNEQEHVYLCQLQFESLWTYKQNTRGVILGVTLKQVELNFIEGKMPKEANTRLQKAYTNKNARPKRT